MKKTIPLSAMVLGLLIVAAIAAYELYDYNDNKPIILKCTVSESPTSPDRVGASYFWKFPTIVGWSVDADPSSALYWDAAEDDWIPFHRTGAGSFFKADKNRFTWYDERTRGYVLKMEIDRNSGGFSVMGWYPEISFLPGSECGESPRPACVVIERGNCVKSAEPAKKLKQRF